MSNNNTNIIKKSIYIILFIALIGYSLYNSRILIKGPEIIITEPSNGSVIEDSPLIRVKGSATNIAFIELNGKQINVNEDSVFDEPTLLYPGYNVITISAVDKFERNITEKIELVYKAEDLLEQKNELIKSLESEITLETATTSLELSTSSPTTSLEEI